MLWFLIVLSCSSYADSRVERLNHCDRDADCLNTGLGEDLLCPVLCTDVGILIHRKESTALERLKDEKRPRSDQNPPSMGVAPICPVAMCAGELQKHAIRCMKKKCRAVPIR